MNTPRFPEVLPAAWMGYANGEQFNQPGRRLPSRQPCIRVRVCAWCPDKAAADSLAQAHGWAVTHEICVPCARKMQDLQVP